MLALARYNHRSLLLELDMQVACFAMKMISHVDKSRAFPSSVHKLTYHHSLLSKYSNDPRTNPTHPKMTLQDLILYTSRILGGFRPLIPLALWVLVGYAVFRVVQAVLSRQ